MRKKVATKLIALLMTLLLVVTAIPTGNVTAQAAAKKPGAVTKITKSEVNPTTITIQYNKVKNAKGYQIRTYKGKKLVKSAKTKGISYTIKGLSAETKYTIKVRAYNGSKYGKEKSITVKTETKNLAVTSLKVSKVTKDSVKITYKKAQNAKGYQIRVYKGSKQVANVKTKNTSYTIRKLSANTKYTIRVRAYKGNKYGKEKSIAVKTSAPTPEESSTEDANSGIVMPGESTSTGDKLVAEYNAYVSHVAEGRKADNKDIFDHLGAEFTYSAEYDDKYSMFKYAKGTANAVADYMVDVLNAYGIPAERYYNVANDVEMFLLNITLVSGDLVDIGADNFSYIFPDSSAFLYTINENQSVGTCYHRPDYKYLNGPHYSLTKEKERYIITARCPKCGSERMASFNVAHIQAELAKNGKVTLGCTWRCRCIDPWGGSSSFTCSKEFTMTDFPTGVYRFDLSDYTETPEYVVVDPITN